MPITDELVRATISQGILGVVCIALCFVVWKLYTDLLAERAANQALAEAYQKQLQAVNDARIDDAKRTMESVLVFARSVDRNTEVVKDATEAFRDATRR